MSSPIVFHFDFVSPYAWLAWTQIHALAAKHGREVAPSPVLFAAILNAHGQKGPAEIPAKRAYVFKDASRKAHRFGLPALRPPPSHPFNPLLALRSARFPADAGARRRFVDALFSATWTEGTGVETERDVAAAASRAGLDEGAVLSFARSEDGTRALRVATDDAVSAGVFGVPTMVADGEIFWGVDALDSLDAFLAGADPIARDLVERWAHVPASATRRPP